MQTSSSKWFLPLVCACLGLLFLAAMWTGGDPGTGLFSLGVMVSFGLLILLGGRSETIRGLRGDGRDERFRRIDLAATALAGIVLVAVIIGAFLVEIARGQDGSPYAALGAVAGLAYLGAIVALRLRG
jgi:hypothetical protein